MKASVIMPVERIGGDAERAIASVLAQDAPFEFELIIVSAVAVAIPPDDRVRNVVETNRNPATRRNRAADLARGELLAFIDDDAFASPDWLATAAAYLEDHPDALAIGGPDPAPDDSTIAEQFSETLLATPWIGSGVACHEDRRGVFTVEAPSDLALVNLIIRRSAFQGFDEEIGYIGEDTALLAKLMAHGRIVYHDGVRVRHRRRAFPGPYLRQRWRYRVKTGRLFAEGRLAPRSAAKVRRFLIAGILGILLAVVTVPAYAVLTFILGARTTRLAPIWWPLLPFAFALHHGTYFLGILWGMGKLRIEN